MSDIRWDVLAAKGAFSAVPGRVIGQVTAPDLRTAKQRARFHYGPDVGVQATIARESTTRERLGPGVLPARERKTPTHATKSKQAHRAFCATKRAAAKAGPATGRDTQHQAELPLGRHGAGTPKNQTKPNTRGPHA